MLSRFSKLLSLTARALSVAGLVMITLVISWQVFARYVLNASPSWSEQAALYLMLWFILFAAAAGVRERFHIRLTILQSALGEKHGRWLDCACHLVVAAFGIAMTIGGGQLVLETWSHRIPALGLPRGSAYIPIVAAGAMIVFFALEHFAHEVRGKEVQAAWN